MAVIAVTTERRAGETRVAAVPETVKKLIAAGFSVVVEAGAGDAASYPDADYEAAGATLADIAMNHIFLKDLADYAAFNAVYAEYFPGAKPARYCIKCELVKPGCLVEIASVAHLG